MVVRVFLAGLLLATVAAWAAQGGEDRAGVAGQTAEGLERRESTSATRTGGQEAAQPEQETLAPPPATAQPALEEPAAALPATAQPALEEPAAVPPVPPVSGAEVAEVAEEPAAPPASTATAQPAGEAASASTPAATGEETTSAAQPAVEEPAAAPVPATIAQPARGAASGSAPAAIGEETTSAAQRAMEEPAAAAQKAAGQAPPLAAPLPAGEQSTPSTQRTAGPALPPLESPIDGEPSGTVDFSPAMAESPDSGGPGVSSPPLPGQPPVSAAGGGPVGQKEGALPDGQQPGSPAAAAAAPDAGGEAATMPGTAGPALSAALPADGARSGAGRPDWRADPGGGLDGKFFPASPLIEAQKRFWIGIFSRYSTEEGVIHDGVLTQPVYEALDLRPMSRRAQRRYVKRRKRIVTAALRRLARALAKGEQPQQEGRRLLELLPPGITPREIRKRAAEVRFQRGLSDRFRTGLITSGALMTQMRAILASQGVPRDLAYLPHVESSFNLKAYSKFGAAGIWQFTRGTGKIFMKIRYEVDERLDPLKATAAAAKYLRQNYERLQTWPLAITAYNHGPLGLARIVARRGTRDLTDFIRNYHGRLFKFASKNFYSEFLAAREVATHYEKYFGELELDQPIEFAMVKMPFFLDFAVATRALGIEEKLLAKLNPALRTPVIVGSKFIPRGFALRVPPAVTPEKFVAGVPKKDRHGRQKRTEVVRVVRGDTLYGLGKRYRVPWTVIARANNITAYNRLRPGQRVVIPRRGKGPAKWVAKALPEPRRKTSRRLARVAVNGARPGTPVLDEKARAIAFQRAEGASSFQDLRFRRYDSEDAAGVIVAAYGETVGHYASWAGVAARVIREYNQMRYGSLLQPGRRMTVPLDEVSLEAFSQARFEYHQSREEDFYSVYAVSELLKVKVRRGDSVWIIAQGANVPMWLFYRNNPGLIGKPLRAGQTVFLPEIEELATLGGDAPAQIHAPVP